jgi:hypothetical protein
LVGAVLNLDAGITQLSASSDRFPDLDFGLTLIENNRFLGEVPLEYGDNRIQVSVTSSNGVSDSAVINATRTASAVPSIQFISHSPNQIVDQASVSLSGRLYSSLDADQIQLTLDDTAVDISQLQPGIYAFTQPGVELGFGFNQIVARAQTPLGNSQAALVIYFQDTQSDPDQPLSLSLTTPSDQQIVNDNFLLVRGQLQNASSAVQLQVNGVPVALFGSEQGGWQFNSGVDLRSLNEGEVVVTVDVNDTGKTPVQVTRTITVDRAAPALSIDNNLQAPPAVNEVLESPLVITGTVSDANLAALTINGLPAILSPGSGEGTYLINSSLVLKRGEETSVVLLATDRAGNETRLSYQVLSNPGAEIEVIQPLANTEYQVFNGNQTIGTIARVNNAPVDSRLRVEVGAASIEQSITQAIVASDLSLAADESIDNVRFTLLAADDSVLARQSVPISVIDAANISLKLEKTLPQQGDRFREPHFPIQFYFNRPVALADITVDARQTVHGKSYFADQPSGAGLGETYQGGTVEVNLDQAPVAGSLSLLPGERIVEFYPATDFYYGARVFVSLSYQGNPLKRFYYEVRSNPTFIKTSLFDQSGQTISGVKVSVPALQLEGQTDANGTLLFGGAAPASQQIQTGLYQMLLNPGQANPAYGTRDIKVQITAGQVNLFSGLRLPELSPLVAYRYLQSGVANNVLVDGDLEIDTQNATLEFANGQVDGQVHVQIADYSDGLYSAGVIELAPLWMFNLQPGPIRVDGQIGLKIRMPALYGSHDYVPPNGTRVLLMGLDDASGVIEPIGVGRIDGLHVTSEGVLKPARLDYLGYQFVAAESQALAESYANGDIGLDALRQGILER